jgi:hypothetical protein
MATYSIIGGDGKEYSSVLGEDLRRWIAEGRLSAQSLAKAESDAEFRPLSTFPEFADAFTPPPEAPGAPPVFSPAGIADGDYELDIGGCISHGWNLVKENFGTLFFGFLVMIAVEMAFIGVLNVLTMGFSKSLLQAPIELRLGYNYFFTGVVSLVMGPLMGGLYLLYLKTIRRQATGVGEVFAGFQNGYIQLVLGALVVSLIVNACMLPFQFFWQTKAGPLMEQIQQAHNDPTAIQNVLPQLGSIFLNTLPVLIICLIPVTYLTVCWQFTLPLIIDKQIGFSTAMKTSFKMVNKHWWQIFGLTIVAGLVSIAGILGCCIGALFTAPIGVAAMMIAYETIFSRPQTG